MAGLGDIEQLTRDYAETTNKLTTLIKTLEDKIHDIKKGYLPEISDLAKQAAEEKALLFEAIKESEDLFIKPKTLVIAGIKVGFQKKKGKLKILNNAATIKRIKEQLADKADVLIKTEDKLLKQALSTLTGEELKKIGVEITADTDDVIIKSAADEVEKFVDALIDEEVKYQLKEGA